MTIASGTVLLFSGGLDSTALAAIMRPKVLLFVDYGQRPAQAEMRAATNVATALRLSLTTIHLGIKELGSGLLLDESESTLETAPSPEWWPYRNQFLATAGAAVALQHSCADVALGTVAPDGLRHADGTQDFYRALDAVVSLQEGGIRINAPGISKTTEQLINDAGLDEAVLGWTTSCHRSNLVCGSCPGCWKRQRVLASLGIQGYTKDL
ncbi:7-cyano-7-deazaguanine synthase [Clavibacter michiganensis]|uniref:7-cyano-7-deazaguanine synthase n=1 Tax=Clavibacter michiganensis TaxID=28447 RepID=UPI003464A768